MHQVRADVGSGQHLQRSVCGVGMREGDPGGGFFMRIETEIGAVLMPGDVSAILATFGEDRSAEQEDVRTDQVFERVENARAAGELRPEKAWPSGP